MKKLLLALTLLIASTASAVELGKQADGSVVVVIPAEIVVACQENGGCNLMNRAEFNEAVVTIIEKHKKEICDFKEAAK